MTTGYSVARGLALFLVVTMAMGGGRITPTFAVSGPALLPPPSLFLLPAPLTGGKPSFDGWSDHGLVAPAAGQPINAYGYTIDDQNYGSMQVDSYEVDTYMSSSAATQGTRRTQQTDQGGNRLLHIPHPSTPDEWAFLAGNQAEAGGSFRNIAVVATFAPLGGNTRAAQRRTLSVIAALVVKVMTYQPPSAAMRNRAFRAFTQAMNAIAAPCLSAVAPLLRAYQAYLTGTGDASTVNVLGGDAVDPCLVAAGTLNTQTERGRLPVVLQPYVPVA